MAKVVRCLCAALFLSAVTAGTALADHDPNPSQIPAAVAQYVEMFPTSAGPSTGSGTKNSIPPKVASAIDEKGGKDASTLERILRSSAGPTQPNKSIAKPTHARATKPEPVAPKVSTRPVASPPLKIPPARHRGSLVALVDTSPGKTFGFWLLLASATVVAFMLRRATRNEGTAPPSFRS